MNQMPSTAPPLRAILPKSLSMSSSQPESSLRCNQCLRSFKTDRGLRQHISKSKCTVNSQLRPELQPTTQNDIPVWGSHTFSDIEQIINATYEEVVHWRKNIFLLPTVAAGKLFIRETTRVLTLWLKDTRLGSLSFKALMIMPSLLLQNPSYKSRAKEHSECLKRRLESLQNGPFEVLMSECRTIQKNLKNYTRASNPDYIARTFAKHILNGKINAALRLLDYAESSFAPESERLE